MIDKEKVLDELRNYLFYSSLEGTAQKLIKSIKDEDILGRMIIDLLVDAQVGKFR